LEEARVPEPILIDPIVLAEFLDLVRRRWGLDASRRAMADLLQIPTVRVTTAPKPAAVARVMERHGGLSWFDAAAICTGLNEGARLRTFDSRQAKAFKLL
jgi:predicted nucleic acid-binding protein